MPHSPASAQPTSAGPHVRAAGMSRDKDVRYATRAGARSLAKHRDDGLRDTTGCSNRDAGPERPTEGATDTRGGRKMRTQWLGAPTRWLGREVAAWARLWPEAMSGGRAADRRGASGGRRRFEASIVRGWG
ncbi:hypothetical protein TvY486_0037310 [Trypanosoma vivax Y486]|uniref:Uncharacterized protein n=1 Tax=Trypanosoma vivax (strain Y486) TaxID=1055687 RepID=F9WTG1_TRYVY|nr:hypothetical protein TvY486_0037310 [Trypanosoma vivax Y486]|eukprot:CCD20854.1 hypothetical protein TvY486_0037310 [Trypanosoma vivax Y486]